jgi:hypothetical protein
MANALGFVVGGVALTAVAAAAVWGLTNSAAPRSWLVRICRVAAYFSAISVALLAWAVIWTPII